MDFVFFFFKKNCVFKGVISFRFLIQTSYEYYVHVLVIVFLNFINMSSDNCDLGNELGKSLVADLKARFTIWKGSSGKTLRQLLELQVNDWLEQEPWCDLPDSHPTFLKEAIEVVKKCEQKNVELLFKLVSGKKEVNSKVKLKKKIAKKEKMVELMSTPFVMLRHFKPS